MRTKQWLKPIAVGAVVLIIASFLQVSRASLSFAAGTYSETTGGAANTWTNYTNAGGSQGPTIPGFATIQIACALQGFRVADGNTWWYQIAQSPWNYTYYVSADAFYNNGSTSGSLRGTPFVDPAVPTCGSGSGTSETTGGAANTWTNYSNAGGTQGPTIGGFATIQIACKLQGFRVADGNTWWYQIASAPWNNAFFVSADAFYNNGATSGSLHGTPFVDPAVPDCSSGSPGGTGGLNETTGGAANTWTNYSNAGGSQGPTVPGLATVQIACKVTGFAVADGNTWWYQIASSPWNGAFYVSADAFYNNGSTSGSLIGTPFVDASVASCATTTGSRPGGETTGGAANSWANYSHAGGTQGPTVPGFTTVQVACRVTGFAVADSNTWWYLIASSPWNSIFYVSADAFYNNGATSGSLSGTPFVDPAIPVCVNNPEQPIYSTAVGSSSAAAHSSQCASADPVDCASGDFWQSFTDVSVTGRGPELEVTRTYNDLEATMPGLFGYGWSSSLDQHLTFNTHDGSVTIALADGSQMTAEPNSSGFTVPSWADSTLTHNGDGTYTLSRLATQFMTFSGAGRLVSVHDLNGYQLTLSYNASNQLTTVTDAAGRALTVTVGSNGFASSVTDPMGRVTSYGYTAAGDLSSVADSLGRTTTFGYDGGHQLLTMTDPRGGVVTNTYNAQGQVTTQTDAAGLRTAFTYTGDNFSSLGGTTTVTDPHGNVEIKQYVNGFLTRLTKAAGTPAQAISTYTYDPATFGITSVTDPNGNVTTHTYDSVGHVLTTTDPLGHTATSTYNALGEPLTNATPLGEVTTKTYDGSGNPLTVADPLGKTTAYGHSDAAQPGDVTSITDPDGRVTVLTYDGDGDVVSQGVSPAAGTTDTAIATYDADGEVICTSSADASASGMSCPAPGATRVAGTTTTGYDAAGEAISVTDPNGNTTQFGYDADGNRTQVTDPKGNITTSTFDADNRLLSTAAGTNGPSPSTTTDAYDLPPGSSNCPATANVTYCTTTTNPNGGVTVDQYDARDDKIGETLPGLQAAEYGYDADDNQLSKTDAAGRTTTNTFDAADRLTSTAYSDGATPGVVFGYDADGRRTSMSDGSGSTSYLLDGDGRATSVTNGAGATVLYRYDGKGDVTSLTYPNGQVVSRSFDGAGRLASVTDWLGHITGFGYDADGNVDSTVYPNGDTVSSNFDPTGALTGTAVAPTGAAGAPLATVGYTRDADGLVSKEVDTGALSGTTTFAYDAQDQLGSAGTKAFGYDPAGDLVSKAGAVQTFNGAGQLTGSTSGSLATSYSYDAVGNRVSALVSSGAGTGYGYDEAGRLTSVSQVVPPPAVNGVTPASGPVKGATKVTVTGTGFTGATAVTFGSVPAPAFTVASSTKIMATAPPGVAGVADVAVTGAGGASAPVPGDHYRYVGPPTVTGVTPPAGPTGGGTTVTVAGTGFTGASKVAFGQVPASSFMVQSDTQLTAVSPAQGAAVRNIVVTTAAGASATVPADDFTYTAAPTVTAVSPGSGPAKGATKVTINGTGFSGATSVAFGAVPAASFTVASATRISAIAPAEAAGIVDVAVAGPNGASTVGPGDRYTFVGPAAVTGVTPSSGPTGGGTSVTVTGTGLSGATKVAFGSVAATFTVVSDTQITAVSPAEAAASRNIVVTTPGGASPVVAADKFTYTAATTMALTRHATAGDSARVAATPAGPAPTATYWYNGDGLRVTQTTSAGTTQFTWDTTTSVPEVLNDGTNSYLYGPGGLPIEQIDTSSAATYYLHDNTGSTRALLTANGAIGATFTYNAYGSLAATTGTLKTPLQFAQSYTDQATGLLYLVNRYYDPTTAQFLTIDPAVSTTGTPFSYASGDPINNIDPFGLIPWGKLFTAVAIGVGIAGSVAAVVGFAPVIAVGSLSLGAFDIAAFGLGAIATGIDCRHGFDTGCEADIAGLALGGAGLAVGGSYGAYLGTAAVGLSIRELVTPDSGPTPSSHPSTGAGLPVPQTSPPRAPSNEACEY